MTNQTLIAKNSDYNQSEDYSFLRSKGIEFIEQLGSLEWTDYNSHDPGITILEALCYAITDLGFRAGWDIKDLLANPPGKVPAPELQAFFTARNILTVNPLTVNDYRRLLADLDLVRNAWLVCRNCACEIGLYGNCQESELVYDHPPKQEQKIKVIPKGTYDVLLELENDPKLGDLNNRKLRNQFTVKNDADNRRYPVVMELRFPDLESVFWGPIFSKTKVGGQWTVTPRKINSILIQRFSLNTEGNAAVNDDLKNPQNLFYTTLQVELDDGQIVQIKDATVRLFCKNAIREKLTISIVESQLKNATESGAVQLFFEKMAKVEEAVLLVQDQLHTHRNLAEDFCCIGRVGVEDVAVCADIEVKPDADIDKVQSQVLFEIENYFNPGVKFYSLQEMLENKIPVEEIFEGPLLAHGFLKNTDLEAAQIKHQLRTSDLINQLVEIEGVIAVKDLMLTRYDDLGRPVRGVADLERGNPNQLSARWTLEISDRCQPRLYVENSKFLFIKNGLPFIAREEEVHHTLQQLRGESERLKITQHPAEDLAVPLGRYRDPGQYFPVQCSFPMTYGVGYEGIRNDAPAERHARAKQLKAFLLFFEQLLVNQLAQIANVKNLFSLDSTVKQTYYVKKLRNNDLIPGSEELIATPLDEIRLQKMQESDPEYLDRRNRFLDHLLARFAEDFTDYALLQFSLSDDRIQAQKELIEIKRKLLINYPDNSRNRARAINCHNPISDTNHAVLRRRIAHLLGLDETTEKQIFIIEHLLLRPRFPGDAVMPICLDPACHTCNDAEPYSFQITVVMPGWAMLTDDDLNWRRYADRTIQLEVPAHILVKICWAGDEQLEFDPCADGLRPVVETICQKGISTGGNQSNGKEIERALEVIWKAFKASFDIWMEGQEHEFFEQEDTQKALELFFTSKDPFLNINDTVITNWADLRPQVHFQMAAYFAIVAVEGLQYTRLKKAWEDWFSKVLKTDWCSSMPLRAGLERLMLTAKIKQVFGEEKREVLKLEEVELVKNCACAMVERFGHIYYQGVTAKLNTREDIPNWDLEPIVTDILEGLFADQTNCSALRKIFTKELQKDITALFVRMYPDVLVESSRSLKRLIGLLSNVRSVYPPATLHDCDDGNDDNPVRLDNTSLGGSL